MSIDRYEYRNRLLMEIDAIRDALVDFEIAAKFDPLNALEDAAYADLLSAVYDLTEIDAVHEAAEEVRDRNFQTSEQIAECRRRGNHLRADILEARQS